MVSQRQEAAQPLDPASEGTLLKQKQGLWEITYEIRYIFKESVLRPYR